MGCGATSDLAGRAWEHRERVLDGFTKRYWAGRLVYFEPHDTADSMMAREKRMKRWRRQWKINAIEAITEKDLRTVCDPDRTDADVHVRKGSFYKPLLRKHFHFVGCGLYYARSGDLLFYELERGGS